jgi:uncharacterized protein YyaL (SSP411 family)
VGGAQGILEDYAAVAQAFVRLGCATGDPRWVSRATTLVGVITDEFDDGQGGFYDTAHDAEALYTRPQDATDNATPSGLSSAVHALSLLAELTGDPLLGARAEQAAATAGALVRQAPRFAGWLLADAVSRSGPRPPVEVAVVGGSDEEVAQLRHAAYLYAPAGSVIVTGPPDQEGVPLLQDRVLRDGKATAYVCRAFVCRLPVTSVAELVGQLSG